MWVTLWQNEGKTYPTVTLENRIGRQNPPTKLHQNNKQKYNPPKKKKKKKKPTTRIQLTLWRLTFECKIYTIVLDMPLKYTPVTKNILCQCKNHTTFKLQWTRIWKKKQKQFAVNDSDTPMTLKLGQGHQTWPELVDPKQGYNNAQLKKLLLNSVREKAKDKVFVKSGKSKCRPWARS